MGIEFRFIRPLPAALTAGHYYCLVHIEEKLRRFISELKPHFPQEGGTRSLRFDNGRNAKGLLGWKFFCYCYSFYLYSFYILE